MTRYDNIDPARQRLEKCARQVNAATPTPTLSSDGAPSRAVLDFCRKYGFSLDYIFCGKEPQRRQAVKGGEG